LRDTSILLLAKAFPPATGGVETYSEHIAREYARTGRRVVVLTQHPGQAGITTRQYPEGAVEIRNVGRGSQPVVFVKMLAAAARLLRERPFEFVHATTWRPVLAIWPWQTRLRLVLTVHGREALIYPFILRGVLRRILRRADVVVCVSEATMKVARDALRGAPALGTWIVNFNGLSHADQALRYHRPSGSIQTQMRLLSFARLVERKNIQGCLTALARLKSQGVANFHYTIAGTGPMYDRLRKLSAEASLDGMVSFLGYVNDADIPGLYEQADVFLHPQIAASAGSDFEGFGLVIADAMSFGCTVIAGTDGGPAEFVTNGERGLLVDGTDSDALANAISSVLHDENRRRQLGQEARRWALANLDWQKHANHIIGALALTGKPSS
jgi:glycosyltransferase involved in cell wall biosynthesis